MQSLLASFPSLARHIDVFLDRQALAEDRLRTGMRINRPADDPAAFQLSLSLASDIRLETQARKNLLTGLLHLDSLAVELTGLSERIARLDRETRAAGAVGGQRFGQAIRSLSDEHDHLLARAGAPAIIIGGDGSPESRFDLGQELGLEPLAPNALAGGKGGKEGSAQQATALRQAVDMNLARVAAVRSRLLHIDSHLARHTGDLLEAESRITDADLAAETAAFLANGIRARRAGAALLHGLLARQRAAELLLKFETN